MSNIFYLTHPTQSQFVNSPDSLAYRKMIANKDILSLFYKMYGNGTSHDQINFGYEYAKSCAKYCIVKLSATKNPEKELNYYISEFSEAIMILNSQEFNVGVIALYYEIEKIIPSFFFQYKNLKMLKAVISQQIILALLQPVYEQKDKHTMIFTIFNDYKIV